MTTQRLLLGSGGFSTDERRAEWRAELHDFLGSIESFLFIPWAGGNYDQYAARMEELQFNAGHKLDSIHRYGDAVSAVEDAQAVFVGGGNSFRLLHHMYQHRVLDPIRRRVAAGMPYIGVSAGTNMSCPTMMTTNDMPIIQPPSFDALGLIPFQINPHYFAGKTHIKLADESVIPYGGETRDDRLNEYHEENEVPVLGLWEGGILRIEGASAVLKGSAGARLFRKGQPAEDIAAGADVSHLLVSV